MQTRFVGSKFSKLMCVMLALAFCTGILQAAANSTLLIKVTSTPAGASASPVVLTCSTATGPSSATVTVAAVSALSGSSKVYVLPPAAPITLTGYGTVTITPAAGNLGVLSSSVSSLSYIVQLVPTVAGCAAAVPAKTSFLFLAGTSANPANTDAQVFVSFAQDTSASGLVATPSAVTVTCVLNGGTYSPKPAQTVNILSSAAVAGMANTGTPFTLSTPPSWLTLDTSGLTGSSPYTATGTAQSITLAATPTVGPTKGCGNFAAGTSNSTKLHLVSSGTFPSSAPPDVLLPVTLNVVSPTILQTNPASAPLTYVKGSGTPGYVDVAVSSTSVSVPNPFFTIDTSTLPVWLNVDAYSGKAPKNIRFTTNSVADTLAPGTYNVMVNLNSSGYDVKQLPVSLQVNNPAAKLTLAEGPSRNVNWTVGYPPNNLVMTLMSSDAPIPYSITTGGTLPPILVTPSEASGLAYSFGTVIPVTFDASVLAAATPGTTLTGTATITWGNPVSTTVVTFNTTIVAPGATLTTISPGSVPASGTAGTTYVVSLFGTGFVPVTDPNYRTKVGVVSGGVIIADSNVTVQNMNASTITLQITVPTPATSDPNLPFGATSNPSINLGVCNPTLQSDLKTWTCSAPTGLTQKLYFAAGPIVSAVTSASSFQEVTPPAQATIAPYDLISIFGTGFCPTCGSNDVVLGAPDPVKDMYATSLKYTGDNNAIAVTFYASTAAAAAGTGGVSAPMLFAANNQINAAVPGSLSTGTQYVVVSYGTHASTPFAVTIANYNPGIFTVGANGAGDGAILDGNFAPINANNPAGMRAGSDSDSISIFMTGLGTPSTSGVAAAGAPVWPTNCMKVTDFETALGLQAGTSINTADGAIIQGSLIASTFKPPCIDSTKISAKLGTVALPAAAITYAGWVPDSVAGLYQVNLKLPGSDGSGITSFTNFTTAAGNNITKVSGPVQLPIQIIADPSGTPVGSQNNVTIWVMPKLKMTAPSALSGMVGTGWATSNNAVQAGEGTSPYHYLISSGVLPTGLSFNGSTGAISGTPAANTSGNYPITVTATDSATPPVSGTVSFQLGVAGGLVVSGLTPGSVNVTPNMTIPIIVPAGGNVATFSATGGTPAYTYAVTTPASLPTGWSCCTGGVLSIGNTALPSGPTNVTITATDSTPGTALTGSLSFIVNVEQLLVVGPTAGSTVVVSKATGGTIGPFGVTGGTGPYTFAMTAPSSAPTGWTFDATAKTITIDTSAGQVTTPVTITVTDNGALTGTLSFNVQVQ